MNKTKIPWVKNPDGSQGYTFNPITGCLNGCEYCYASRVANTRLKSLYLANGRIAATQTSGHGYHTSKLLDSQDPFYPRIWPERLKEMARRNDLLWADEHVMYIPRKKTTVPRGIFVCSMSDLFGIGIPEEWTNKVLVEIWGNKNFDRFYLLTKQPRNLAKFSPFPDNCYVGVTATDRKQYESAVFHLRQIQAKVKYISFEPLLDRVGRDYYYTSDAQIGSAIVDAPSTIFFPDSPEEVDWVIIGAQTKPTVMPKIEWVKEIVEAADKAGAKVFLKDSLKPLFFESGVSINDTWVWAKDVGKGGLYRQEVP